ncbi:MAG: hypothetical protein LWX01_00875 [Deltaproteobacteria bacterium]|nr:hypothetical protein [Deltaproteobacteria bacterium]MDL1960255.1 hypothetical protein [Deltaproteobacteria bacterium]
MSLRIEWRSSKVHTLLLSARWQEVAGRNVLLIDDLYRSGATLNAVTVALKDKGKAKEVYVLTLTMTRRKR